jgi:phosphoribosylamine--glycine ligase
VGNGAREHAIAWKLRQSPRVADLYVAPGNGGTGTVATNISLAANAVDAIPDWCVAQKIDLVVVGPEEPLALGLADRLTARRIRVFGPTRAAARIESSKSWAKEIMRRAGVPTAAHATFDDPVAAWDYARSHSYPLVVKADGLAAGKGVLIAKTPDEARAAINTALGDRAFGAAGQTILIEEFLEGEEVSLLAIVDGQRAAPLVPARDHKRVGEGDTGPNTGGMGAFAPTQLVSPEELARLRALVIDPVVATLAADGVHFRGALYAGLMLTSSGPKVVEYNCRLGDPETQVVLPLLAEDLAELLYGAANGNLSIVQPATAPGYRCGVVIASGGYPGRYASGYEIHGLSDVDPDALVFHAGTATREGRIVTAGGRVLTVVGQGPTLSAARDHAYANASRIHFEGAFCRSDIGWRETNLSPSPV